MPTVLKFGSLNFLAPLGPVQACNGIALPFYIFLANDNIAAENALQINRRQSLIT
jgi:hypothetical protein